MNRNEDRSGGGESTGDPETITVYSDYICPFCYLGRRSLDAYRERREGDLGVDWRPFDLRSHKRGPDGEIDDSIDDGKDDAYYAEVQRNVEKLREQYGAEEMLDLEELPDGVDSLPAQAASLYVKTEHPDRWLAFDEAVFEALWVDGRDVGDVEVLADLAFEVGLDPDEIRGCVADEEYRDRLRGAFEAAQRDGVTGVPTFVYDDHAARGAVPPEQLERLVDGF
ncbi:DsbA family protein [Halalkaliarchaeum sp. AArc-GB]|uniref:DsbA family oxidoreductase n=1 Tax=Halalkaliarchaeum sp. AArc-GB TaxID=3074078 RepID=UPI00285D0AF1|nr:DsbA family protein [Halalkaliarchaeum sp. AArc-GB]MDR5672826.1 DsbA family protein [Halalkaliarchaeum sp. AArc-GB]